MRLGKDVEEKDATDAKTEQSDGFFFYFQSYLYLDT